MVTKVYTIYIKKQAFARKNVFNKKYPKRLALRIYGIYLYNMQTTTSYCRRFNIAMIWALGLCALTLEIAVLALIYY